MTKKEAKEAEKVYEAKSVHARFIDAKKSFGKAGKNAKNPHLKNNYADLSSVLEAVTDSLNDAGLYFHQVVTSEGLHTSIVSVDGDSIDFGVMPILASKQDAQGYGSGLTYARRYSIMNACGIAPEDDDGARAVETYKPPAKQTPQPVQSSPQRELALAGINALVMELKEEKGIDSDFWPARYGVSTSQMTDDQLAVVKADMQDIKSNFNGIEFIQPFGGF